MEVYEFLISLDEIGIRLDKFLADNKTLSLTRTMLQKLIDMREVTCNGITVPKSYKLKYHDKVLVNIPEPIELDVKPEDLSVEIIYQDNDLLVVNKPKGMVVHPAAGNFNGTLVNALLFHCKGQLSSINGVIRPGIVHRIDKNTSGLLIVAKTDFAHLRLAEQIKSHTFTRKYEAIVCGRLKSKDGIVNAPIGRSIFDRKKMCVTEKNSKVAVTHYHVITEYDKYSYISLQLETGRTHQIRVHMSYIGHPVYGDDVYGNSEKDVIGQCLHAKKIGFVHPRTGEYLEFDSNLPEYFVNILKKL